MDNYFKTLAKVNYRETPYLYSFLQKHIVAKNHYDKWLQRNILVTGKTDEDIECITSEFTNYLAEENDSFICIRYAFMKNFDVEGLERLADTWDTVIIQFNHTDDFYSLYNLSESLLTNLAKRTSIVIICPEDIKECVLQCSNEIWNFIFQFENHVLRMMGSNRYFKVISNKKIVNEQFDLYPTYYKVV